MNRVLCFGNSIEKEREREWVKIFRNWSISVRCTFCFLFCLKISRRVSLYLDRREWYLIICVEILRRLRFFSKWWNVSKRRTCEKIRLISRCRRVNFRVWSIWFTEVWTIFGVWISSICTLIVELGARSFLYWLKWIFFFDKSMSSWLRLRAFLRWRKRSIRYVRDIAEIYRVACRRTRVKNFLIGRFSIIVRETEYIIIRWIRKWKWYLSRRLIGRFRLRCIVTRRVDLRWNLERSLNWLLRIITNRNILFFSVWYRSTWIWTWELVFCRRFWLVDIVWLAVNICRCKNRFDFFWVIKCVRWANEVYFLRDIEVFISKRYSWWLDDLDVSIRFILIFTNWEIKIILVTLSKVYITKRNFKRLACLRRCKRCIVRISVAVKNWCFFSIILKSIENG